MSDGSGKVARAANIDDLKALLQALNDCGADYLLIGGYALHALGYQRGTTDIDIVLRQDKEQGARVRQALMDLPDGAAREIDIEWFMEGQTIRVVDEFVVDLLFNACGETYESLLPHATIIDLDGVPVRTLNIEGLLKTKQSARAKDQMDRIVLERALLESKRQP